MPNLAFRDVSGADVKIPAPGLWNLIVDQACLLTVTVDARLNSAVVGFHKAITGGDLLYIFSALPAAGGLTPAEGGGDLIRTGRDYTVDLDAWGTRTFWLYYLPYLGHTNDRYIVLDLGIDHEVALARRQLDEIDDTEPEPTKTRLFRGGR